MSGGSGSAPPALGNGAGPDQPAGPRASRDRPTNPLDLATHHRTSRRWWCGLLITFRRSVRTSTARR